MGFARHEGSESPIKGKGNKLLRHVLSLSRLLDNGRPVAKAEVPRHREFEGSKFSSSPYFARRSEGLGLQS